MSTPIIPQIFAAFGGLSKLAEAVVCNPSTVHTWTTAKKGIPRWWRPLIVEAGYKLGVPLTTEMLDYLDPGRFIKPPKGYAEQIASSYPDSPGYQATDTSKAAADAIAPSAPLKREVVLKAVKAAGTRGITPDETAAKTGLNILTVRPRFTELKMAGKITDSGARRKNGNGKNAIVWIAA